MIVLKGDEFENAFKLVSQKECVEGNPIWNDIVRYKTALRYAVARKVSNEFITQNRTAGIENFIYDFSDLDFCAKQVIEEVDSDSPPNMIKIIDKLQIGAQINSSKELEGYISNLRLDLLSRTAALYYQKTLGDLYDLIKENFLVGRDFSREFYEISLKKIINANGGMTAFEKNNEDYFFGIRESKKDELLTTFPSLQFLFSSIELNKIEVMKKIIKSEIAWYQVVCGR